MLSLCCAWYVDRVQRTSITGEWGFPDGVEWIVGTAVNYSDELIISNDGNFTKTQSIAPLMKETYSGEWSTVDETGLTRFHVRSVAKNSDPPVTVDFSFLCRCSVDSTGFLIVNEHLIFREMQEYEELVQDVSWQSYRKR